MVDESKNLEFWGQASPVAGKYSLKWAATRGGFVSVDAYERIREATRYWGPFGDKWGIREAKWEVIYDEGKPVGIMMSGFFFCPLGQFPMAIDNPYGAREDACKKLQTGFICKALSYLGVAADAYMGLFEGVESVQQSEATRKQRAMHDSAVALLERAMDGIGPDVDEDRDIVVEWALQKPIPWSQVVETEGLPSEVMNAIQSRKRQDGIKWRDMLKLARDYHAASLSRSKTARRADRD